MKYIMYSGRSCTIAEADQADLSPERLGIKLANMRRWQGMPGALSILEHMNLTAVLAHMFEGNGPALAASLVHDVAEAFIGDLHGPSKTREQKRMEILLELELAQRGWQVLYGNPGRYKRYDYLALAVEKYLLWPGQYPKPGVFDHIDFDQVLTTSATWARHVRECNAYVEV